MTLGEFNQSILDHLESECDKHNLDEEMLLKGVCCVTATIMQICEAESFEVDDLKLILQSTNPNK